jgi:hypothetical protein
MYHRGAFQLSRHLTLPRRWRHVNDYLRAYDADLRLRASVERPGWFVLERRCRRRPAPNTSMRDLSDMHVQARDGFVHVAIVHPEYCNKPWNIIAALQGSGVDLWAYKAPDAFADELEYEEHWAKETRRRRRHEDGRAYYREMFDVLSRLGNKDGTEQTRFSNPGLGSKTSAAPA